jgi:hypothetical protein
VIAALVLAAALGGPPTGVVPTPIGVGRPYRPVAAPARVLGGHPFGGHACGGDGPRYGVHLELFANRRVVLVPAGIGIAKPLRRSGGDVVARGCSYAARTRTPTGVVEVRPDTRLRLADLFAIWGQPLGAHRLAGFRGPVSAFVAGKRWRGAIGAIPLRRHSEIVLEVGGFVPPHHSYLFPGDL